MLLVGLVAAPAHAERPVLHERVDFHRDEDRVALPDEIAAPGADDHVVTPDAFTHAPDDQTGGDDHLVYNVVWDPSVAPFKRSAALDRVRPDGELNVADAARRVPVPVVGGQVAPGREAFRGSMIVQLTPDRPTALPTPAADLRILRVRTTPDTPVSFSRDSADNLYVQARSGGARQIRLALVVDARSDYFGGPDAPPDLGPAPLPEPLREEAQAVIDAIGGRSLAELVAWFRDFRPGSLPRDWGDLYLDIALSKVGVCRHRSYAFVITALAAGIPARFVYNEAHAFVEVQLRDRGWRRVDLGGAALSLDLRNPGQSAPHTPRYPDPFPKPQAYRQSSTQGSIPGGGAPAGAPPGPEPAGAPAGPGAAPSASSDPAAAPGPAAGPDPGAASALSSSTPAAAQVLDIPLELTPATSTRDKLIRLHGEADQPFKPALLAERGDLILHEWPLVTPRDRRFRTRIRIPAEIPPGRYRILAISVPGP